MSTLGKALIGLSALAMITVWLHWQGYGISYQNTGSMPEGWYWMVPVPHQVQRGDIMIFSAPATARALALTHHWMLPNERLMKPVAAVPGDHVCVQDHQIIINHRVIAAQQPDYAPHHALPQWHFCGTIPAGHYLLLSTYAKRSFDGRYFGLVKRAALLARALPLRNASL